MKTTQRSKVPTITDERKIVTAIERYEFDWWLGRVRVKAAREILERQLGGKISKKVFTRLRKSCCKWWMTEPRRRPSSTFVLDADGCERLRTAVGSLRATLLGRPLDEAVAIVSTRVPCNEQLLEGLNSDLRVWKSPVSNR